MEVVAKSMAVVKRQISTLKYFVEVEIETIEKYNELVSWARKNIPSVDRSTPEYHDDVYIGSHIDNVYKFYFRDEDQAMAFKLII